MSFSSPHFRLEETASGVFALIAGDTGACVSNSAIIDLGDKTVVFDTFMTLLAGDDLVRAVADLTGRDAFLVVNSHWHDDHVGSNQLFASAEIVSTRRTAELIAGNVTTDPAAYAQEIDEYLAWAKAQELEAATDDERQRTRSARLGAEALLAGKDRFRLVLPDSFIDDRRLVEGVDRSLEILTYGGGHTESDVFALVPSEGVAILGDLLWVESHPRTNDGFPEEWAAILDRIENLDAPRLIPGHGAVGGSDDLTAMAAYLRYVASVLGSPESPERTPLPPGSESWAGTGRFAAGLDALQSR